MARADQSAARVDRFLTGAVNRAVFDRFVFIARSGDSESGNRGVLARSKAVVSFDYVDLIDVEFRALIRVFDRLARPGQNVFVAFRLGDFVYELHRCDAMAPAFQYRKVVQFLAGFLRELFCVRRARDYQ